jgi:DNA-binding transcriptional LysR family regulator
MLARLEGFVAIAEHGQLGRAAAVLHLTQPSLTARLQRLEAELGTSLGAARSRAAIRRPAGSRSPPRRP